MERRLVALCRQSSLAVLAMRTTLCLDFGARARPLGSVELRYVQLIEDLTPLQACIWGCSTDQLRIGQTTLSITSPATQSGLGEKRLQVNFPCFAGRHKTRRAGDLDPT
jgi:hypothetical protein